MQEWLAFARGPAFIFAFSFMILGYSRHIGLTLWEMRRHMARAGDKSLPYSQLIWATTKWLFPLGKLKNEFWFSITSILFHVAILIVPIFLVGHIALWTRGLGISWIGITDSAADVLTIIAVVTAVLLVIQRASARATRSLSRFQDYALPLLIALPFATGFLVKHPTVNPFSYGSVMLVHVMSANLVFILMPLTKLSHAVLLPSVQLVAEIGWHWPSDSGSQVAKALNKEEEPV